MLKHSKFNLRLARKIVKTIEEKKRKTKPIILLSQFQSTINLLISIKTLKKTFSLFADKTRKKRGKNSDVVLTL